MAKDYIPTNLTAFAAWILNFYVQVLPLATKYGVTTPQLQTLKKDSDWVQYWAETRVGATQQEKQMTGYIDEIADGELNQPAPAQPFWTLPPDPPLQVPTGIKKRCRELANFIKNQKGVYTRADGDLLGIVSPDESGKPEADYQPQLKLQTLPNFHLQAEFRKFGMDAVRFEVRRTGGEWQTLADSARSPADFLVHPTSGDPEQIEVRAVFLKDYKPYGSYSPIYPATIAP